MAEEVVDDEDGLLSSLHTSPQPLEAKRPLAWGKPLFCQRFCLSNSVFPMSDPAGLTFCGQTNKITFDSITVAVMWMD